MSHRAVLTAIGADRPGLVEDVSEFVFKHGGNIEDSRMANLGGQFAMMLLISVPLSVMENMRGELRDLIERSGLHVEIRDAAPLHASARPAVPYRLQASSLDQAGLVHRIAQLLRSLDVNIESMQTTLVAAPYTGAPIFEMDVAMAAPGHLPLSRLRQELARLCDQLNIDWTLSGL